MSTAKLNRRQALYATAMVGTASLLGYRQLFATPKQQGQTPPLSAQEIAAIEAALGKKGQYVQEQAVHNTSLPRNELEITVKGEPVPFGFGG